MCQDIPNTYIFGYGSLIWRCGFPYRHKFNGYIRGYKRLFHQKDNFHRGTTSHPGRCALVQSTNNLSDDYVYGTCYLIPGDEVDEILKSLDTREKTYYRKMVPVYIEGGIYAAMAVLYICDDHYLLSEEEASLEYTAKVIATASGHSGTNFDYLHRLYHSLSRMDHSYSNGSALDPYLVELYDRVVQIRSQLHKDAEKEQEEEEEGQINCLKEQLMHANCNGAVYIDYGAVSAISNRGKALLPCGIVSVISDFKRGDVIEVRCCATSQVIAVGVSNFSSEQVNRIKGKHSKYISEVIPEFTMSRVVPEQNEISEQDKSSRSTTQHCWTEYVISREKMILC